jgi:phosphoribosylformylglycinamidine synthase I
MTLRALVVTAPGINCDGELAEAFDLAGASPELVTLQRLRREPSLVDRFDLVGLPGGFSYGDDIAAGRIMAALIRRDLYRALVSAIRRGVPMIAPCNGFQIAVQAGLLPGPPPGEDWPDEPMPPTVALATNVSARFEDRWTGVEYPRTSVCVWTRDLVHDGDLAVLPSAHGEGRFTTDASTLAALESSGQIAVRYADGENFNGSVKRIAGICDASGLVFGLMPHPERYLRWSRHPRWTRLEPSLRRGDPPGLAMFRNAIAACLAKA